MAALIAQRKAAGTAFVVVEQNLAFAERIADRYLVMDQGRTVLAGERGDDRSRRDARKSACVSAKIHRPTDWPRFSRVAERLVRQHVFGLLDLFGVHRLLIRREAGPSSF